MKRNHIIGATPIVALCLTLAGCSGDDAVETPASKPFTITASLETENSRASVRPSHPGTPSDPDLAQEKFIWNAGDEFKAYLLNTTEDGFEAQPTFTIDNTYSDASPKGYATFTCSSFPTERAYKMLAVYPGGDYVFTVNTGNILTCIINQETTQTGKNSTAHLKEDMAMYATATIPAGSTSIDNLTFHHLTSLFRFTVTNQNASACRIRLIQVASTTQAFGIGWSVHATAYTGGVISSPSGSTIDKLTLCLVNSSTDTKGIEVAAKDADGNTFDAYMCSGPGGDMVNQTLTFSLTVTDVDGTNERIYTSLALDANALKIYTHDPYTWDCGKRYWFDLQLDDEQLIVKLNSVTAMPGWSDEIDL